MKKKIRKLIKLKIYEIKTIYLLLVSKKKTKQNKVCLKVKRSR